MYFKIWNSLTQHIEKIGFALCETVCFFMFNKDRFTKMDKVKADKAYELSGSRMLADLYKMDFGKNSCIER